MEPINLRPKLYLARPVLLFLAAAGLAACNLTAGPQETTPTLDVTQAYQTVEARLTQAVAQTPTQPPETPTARPTATSQVTTPPPTAQLKTATPPPPSAPAGPLCDQAGPGAPIDVTIPDDTVMQPGQTFTKTWRLVNTGSCTWSREYALVLFSGDELGAQTTIPLTQEVASGQSVDLSVDMVAPQKSGSYQSNWKLRNPSGALFGIGPSGGSAFWVRIVVSGEGTLTITPTGGTASTSTPTQQPPTVTPTAGVLVSGSANLQPGDGLDLDSNTVNSGGEDLGYQSTADGLVLQPLGSSLIGVFGSSQPSIGDCRGMNLAAAPVNVGQLAGSFLCYRTGNGLPGWLRVNSIDQATSLLSLDLQTWTTP